jgi:carbonic anhydrase/acetyltransferase-like protein (isoleucine patch superfamily)
VVVPQVLSFPSYNARRSDPMFAFNVMSESMLSSCRQNFQFFQNSKWFTLRRIAVLVNKTETDTVAVDATAVAVATAVVDEAAVVAVDTAAVVETAVAEVTVVAAGAAVVEAAVAEVTVVAAGAAAVDEAAVAEVTVVDEAAAVVEAAAVAEATVVVGVTTVAGDPDSEMATAAAAMTQGRTTVARVVPLKDTEARHEAKPTSLQRIRRKASVTVKPIETTGHRKVASAVAEKETTEPKLILPQHSWLVAKRFHNLQ